MDIEIKNTELLNEKLHQCKWCRSTINKSASFCKECSLWQSPFRQWLSPATLLSILGAAAAWAAVMFQIFSPPNPVLLAANAVEALEEKVKIGCSNNKTNECVGEFWFLHSNAHKTTNMVPKLEERNEFRQRIKTVFNKHSSEYAELYEFVPQNF